MKFKQAHTLSDVSAYQIKQEVFALPNIKSAKKRVKVIETKSLRNQMFKTQLRNVMKKYNAAVDAGDKETAMELYKVATKKIDQAVNHGILHKNNAARKKSTFTIKLNKMA